MGRGGTLARSGSSFYSNDSSKAPGSAKSSSRRSASTLPSLQKNSAEIQELLTCFRQDEVDHEEVRRLLGTCGKGAANVCEETFGWAPLLFAANTGDVALLMLLMDARADVQASCNTGNTALHLAARSGDVDVANLLLSKGAHVEAQNSQGWTPLHWSAIAGQQAVAAMLIDVGADVTAQDGGGRSSLMWAARHGHTGIVSALLAKGIDLSVVDADGRTVLRHAEDFEKTRGMLLSQSKGWHPSAGSSYWPTRDALDLNRLSAQHSAQSSRAQASPQSPADAVREALRASERLIANARANNWDAVEDGLRQGACASTRGKDDMRPAMIWAAMHNAPAAAMSLATAGAQVDTRDSLGWTAVHHAVHAGSAEAISVLHFLGADFAATTLEGDSIHHLAAKADKGAILQLAFPAVGDLEVRDADDHTPLQLAAISNSTSALRTLLALRADPTVADQRGRSVFALAVAHGHVSIVKCLVEPVEPLPQLWEDQDLATLLQKLPWVAEEVEPSSPTASVSSRRSSRSQASRASRKNLRDLPGTLQNARQNLHTIAEVDSEDCASPTLSPRQKALESPRSDASGKSMASKGSMASKTSSKSAASNRSKMSSQSRASNHSKASKATVRSKASGATATSSGRSKLTSQNSASNLNCAARVQSSPIDLMQAACKASLAANSADSKQPAVAAPRALCELDGNGQAPLASAAQSRHSDVVSFLVELRADVNSADTRGNTPLMLAAAQGRKQAVCHLLEARAKLDIQNANLKTAADVAAKPELRRLLQAQADRDEVERKMTRSCSLPSLGNAPGRPGVEPKSKDARYRIRLDGLSKRQPADHLEELIWDMLEDNGVECKASVDVVVDPISLRPRGHAYVDYPSSKSAVAAESTLRCIDDSVSVSLEVL